MANIEDCPGFETFGADVKAARKAKRLSRKTMAEIINVDQGALGGATFVEVYENRGLNLLLFTVAPKSKRVYEGGWADTFDIQLTWKDEEHLVITQRFDYVSGEEFTDIEINLNTVE